VAKLFIEFKGKLFRAKEHRMGTVAGGLFRGKFKAKQVTKFKMTPLFGRDELMANTEEFLRRAIMVKPDCKAK